MFDKPYSESNTIVLRHGALESVKLTANHLVRKNGECSNRYIFLFDTSGSMAGNRIEYAKEAAEKIYDNLSMKNIERNKENVNKFKVWDNYAVGSFSTYVNWLTKINQTNRNGKEGDRFQKQLEKKLKIGGMTAVRDSIIQTYQSVIELNNQTKKILGKIQETYMYVLSDEEDNSSTSSQEDMMRIIKDNPNIHLNIIHISGTPSVDFRAACQESRGRYENIRDATNISMTILNMISVTININS